MYKIAIGDAYVQSVLINGGNFYTRLTQNEDLAYKWSTYTAAIDINHFYCDDAGEILEDDDFSVDEILK